MMEEDDQHDEVEEDLSNNRVLALEENEDILAQANADANHVAGEEVEASMYVEVLKSKERAEADQEELVDDESMENGQFINEEGVDQNQILANNSSAEELERESANSPVQEQVDSCAAGESYVGHTLQTIVLVHEEVRITAPHTDEDESPKEIDMAVDEATNGNLVQEPSISNFQIDLLPTEKISEYDSSFHPHEVHTHANNNDVKKQLLLQEINIEHDQSLDVEVEDGMSVTPTSFNMSGDLSTMEYANIHVVLSSWFEACQSSAQSLSSKEWMDAEVEKYSVALGEDTKFCVASKYHNGSISNIFDDVIQLQADILCLQIEQWIPAIPEEDVNGVLNQFGVRALLNHDKQTDSATLLCFRSDTFPVARCRSCVINISGEIQDSAHGLLQITALQMKDGSAFCLGNLLLPFQNTTLSQDLQSYLISVSFQHLFEAAGGPFNPHLLCAHLHKLDTSSEQYSEAIKGYLSNQHSTLLPISAYKKVFGAEGKESDFIFFSDESVRLHRVVCAQSGEPRQAVFSLGKGLFSHQTRVKVEAELANLALIENVGETCLLSMSVSPKRHKIKKLVETEQDGKEHHFQSSDKNRFWPWI